MKCNICEKMCACTCDFKTEMFKNCNKCQDDSIIVITNDRRFSHKTKQYIAERMKYLYDYNSLSYLPPAPSFRPLNSLTTETKTEIKRQNTRLQCEKVEWKPFLERKALHFHPVLTSHHVFSQHFSSAHFSVDANSLAKNFIIKKMRKINEIQFQDKFMLISQNVNV